MVNPRPPACWGGIVPRLTKPRSRLRSKHGPRSRAYGIPQSGQNADCRSGRTDRRTGAPLRIRPGTDRRQDRPRPCGDLSERNVERGADRPSSVGPARLPKLAEHRHVPEGRGRQRGQPTCCCRGSTELFSNPQAVVHGHAARARVARTCSATLDEFMRIPTYPAPVIPI